MAVSTETATRVRDPGTVDPPTSGLLTPGIDPDLADTGGEPVETCSTRWCEGAPAMYGVMCSLGPMWEALTQWTSLSNLLGATILLFFLAVHVVAVSLVVRS